jgi:HEAT repeat protein
MYRGVIVRLQVLLVSSLLATAVMAQPSKTLSDMEPALAKIAVYEYGQAREPLSEFDQFMRESFARKTDLGAIEQRLLKLLESDATLAGKDVACRHLSMIGGRASVPLLSRMLLQPETAEMARYALQRIPSEDVDVTLRAALPKTAGIAKIGIINSLGQRHDVGSVHLLKPLLVSNEAGIAEASAAALGQIANAEALEAISSQRAKVPESARFTISEAYLACAAKAPRDSAMRAAKELSAASEPVMIRIAALGLLASVASGEAVPTLAAQLESSDAKIQAAAVRLLSGIPAPGAAQALIGAFPKTSPEGQVRILTAVAEHNVSGARPLIATAAASKSTEVRTAAWSALGTLGDRSNVMTLADAAANRDGAEQTAARESLYRLQGPDIDSSIAAAIGRSNGKAKVELIRAAGERGIVAAAPALLASARDADRDIKRESLRALRDTANPSQAPQLLALLVETESANDRREAGRTLATVLKKSGSPDVDGVIAAYGSATAPGIKTSLLEVMGQVASPHALPTIVSGLKESDREINRAAILALTDWPTPEPMPDLLAVAKSGSNPTSQVLALRGYTKLAAIPNARPNSETAHLLAGAMSLAAQPEEKKAILAVLPGCPSQEALELAEASLNDPAVGKEAKAASDRIRRALNAQK